VKTSGESSRLAGSEVRRQDAALGAVRELLTALGIHSHLIEWLNITMRSSGGHYGYSKVSRYAPELLSFAPTGRRIAAVRVGEKTPSFVVELARFSPDALVLPDTRVLLPGHRPEQVVSLIHHYWIGWPR
jgi:hypothetical protein